MIIYAQRNSFHVSNEKFILVDRTLDSSDVGSDFRGYENDSCSCSTAKKCLCNLFDDALVHVENNTIIAINNTIGLSLNIALWNTTNISIIGYHGEVVVHCSNRGSIEFKNCDNIIIENITWIECGSNNDRKVVLSDSYVNNFDDDFANIYLYGLKFSYCTNVGLKSCTFNASMIGFFAVSGTVHVDQVNFLSNNAYITNDIIQSATGLIINQTNVNNRAVVEITNSIFSEFGSNRYNYALLLFYVLVDDPGSIIQVFVNQTEFSSASYNPGWAAENGMVWIRILSCRDAYIKFHEVKFHSNNYDFRNNFAILHINVTMFNVSQTTSRIVIESSSFSNNTAHKIACFKGDMYLDVINTHFSNNKANTVFFVTTSFYGEFLSNIHVITTAVEILQCTFCNNTHGSLMSFNGTYILAIISEIQIMNNILLSGYDGLVLFQHYDTLVVNITNIEYHLNKIEGEGSGFHFTSNQINELPYFRYSPSDSPVPQNQYACILQEFLYFVPSSQFADEDCLESDYQSLSFTNGSFINNTGRGHGGIIYFDIPQFSYQNTFTNMICTSTFNSNNGFESLIHVSNNGFAIVRLIVKDSTFMNNNANVFYVLNQVIQFVNENKSTVFENNKAQNGAALYLNLNSISNIY